MQHVHTDGHRFHFTAFQLNTLELDTDGGVKNMFWEGEPEEWADEFGNSGNRTSLLFEKCENVLARPTLEGYGRKVFDRFLAMYMRQ